MIIEILGPGGAGKTTIEPLIASQLGIAHFPGRKRHGFSDEPLSDIQVWSSRLLSVVENPLLFAAAVRMLQGTPERKLRFALDLCRRNRIARRASRMNSGVVASGPLHGVCQGSARHESDLNQLARMIQAADVYLRLKVDPETSADRLRNRIGEDSGILGRHQEWTERYETAADAALASLASHVVEVDANGPTEVVVTTALRELRPILQQHGIV